jgi:hypothetical protein
MNLADRIREIRNVPEVKNINHCLQDVMYGRGEPSNPIWGVCAAVRFSDYPFSGSRRIVVQRTEEHFKATNESQAS